MPDFTTSVQDEIDRNLARTIAEGNRAFDLCAEAKSVCGFLNDTTNLNTPGFVLRRYLQQHAPAWVEDAAGGEDFADLTAGKNLPWPDKMVRRLAGTLAEASAAAGTDILQPAWARYLSDRGGMQRGGVFRAAFTLRMDTTATQQLLLACGKSEYSVRSPEDFISLYCQKQPGAYSWNRRNTLLKEYRKTAETGAARHGELPQQGMTEQLQGKIGSLMESALPEAERDKALLAYMAEHRAEFTALQKAGAKKGGKQANDEPDEAYLPGYSLTRRELFFRFAEYLAAEYPARYLADDDAEKGSAVGLYEFTAQDGKIKRVTDPNTVSGAKLSLSDLCAALFEGVGELPDGRPDGSLIREQITGYCNNFYPHVNGIDRTLRKPEHAKAVERRDVLLMAYFFIKAYLENEDFGLEDRLQALMRRPDPFDEKMEEAVARLDELQRTDAGYLHSRGPEEDSFLAGGFRGVLNLFLLTFGFPAFYAPNVFDRFILLLLLSDSPDDLFEEVLWGGPSGENGGQNDDAAE